MSLLRWLTYPFRREPRRPLSARQPIIRQPDETPLGMEELDMKLIAQVNRRNDSLERMHAPVSKGSAFLPFSGTRHASTHVEPMPDDETYAAQYHRAFNKKGS